MIATDVKHTNATCWRRTASCAMLSVFDGTIPNGNTALT